MVQPTPTAREVRRKTKTVIGDRKQQRQNEKEQTHKRETYEEERGRSGRKNTPRTVCHPTTIPNGKVTRETDGSNGSRRLSLDRHEGIRDVES